jgi:hypothetical protein
MRKAWIICAVALAFGAIPESSRAFFDRQRLGSEPEGPIVAFHVIDPAFGAPSPSCGAWCRSPTYAYPAYIPGRIFWAEPLRPGVPRVHRVPRYFPSRRR